jgi:hypothetical protein
VNNAVFTSYHLFHATTRILPGAKPTEWRCAPWSRDQFVTSFCNCSA